MMTARPAQIQPSALSPTEWDTWSGVITAFQAEGPVEMGADDDVRRLWDWLDGRLERKVDAGRVKEILAFFRTLPPPVTPIHTLLAMLRLVSHSVDNSRLTRDHLFLQHPEPVLILSTPPTASPALASANIGRNPFEQSTYSTGSSTPKPWVATGASAAANKPVSRASTNPFRQSFAKAPTELPASPPHSVAPAPATPWSSKESSASSLATAQAAASPPLPPRPVFRAAPQRKAPKAAMAPPPIPVRRSESLRVQSPSSDGTPRPAERTAPSPTPLPSVATPDSSHAPIVTASPTWSRPPTPQRKPGSLTSSSHLGLDTNASLRPPSTGRMSAASGVAEGKGGVDSVGRRSRGNSSASTTASSWTLELAAPSSPSAKKQPSPLPPALPLASSFTKAAPTSPSQSRFKGFSAASVQLPPPSSPAASSTTITPGHSGDLRRSKTVGSRPPLPPKRRPSTQVSPTGLTSPFTNHPPSAFHSRTPSLPHPVVPPRRNPSSASGSIAALGESLVSKAKDEVVRRTSSLRSAPSAAYGVEGAARARLRMEAEQEMEKERREEGMGLIGAAAAEEASSERDEDDSVEDPGGGDPFTGARFRRRRTVSSTSESELEGAGEGSLGGFEEDDDEEKREEGRRNRERRKEVEREARRREEEGQWERLS